MGGEVTGDGRQRYCEAGTDPSEVCERVARSAEMTARTGRSAVQRYRDEPRRYREREAHDLEQCRHRGCEPRGSEKCTPVSVIRADRSERAPHRSEQRNTDESL